MSAMASQITSLTIVYSNVYSGADQSKQQSSASLAFVQGIHRWPVNSPHKGPVTRKMFPFDDVSMKYIHIMPANIPRLLLATALRQAWLLSKDLNIFFQYEISITWAQVQFHGQWIWNVYTYIHLK